MLAVAVLPVPPSIDVTGSVTLTCNPVATPVTCAVTVQDQAGARGPPPVNEMVPLPATAVTVPLQEFVMTLGVATFKPAGKLSVKATPVKTLLGLVLRMLNSNVVTPFSGSTATLKSLRMTGGKATIVLAVATLPVPASSELMADEVLSFTPGVVPVTRRAT